MANPTSHHFKAMPNALARVFVLATAMCGIVPPALAQAIYTCTDAQGRRLTSDRPIIECIDRTQKELNPSGTVKRTVGPTLTAVERTADEEKKRKAAEDLTRVAEQRRSDRALLQRYPNRAAHDRERAVAIAHIDDIIKAAARRDDDLVKQKKAIDTELEFFRGDASKATPKLKQQISEYEKSVALSKRFLVGQEEEKKRVGLRFDAELKKLERVWAETGNPSQASASASAAQPVPAVKK